MKNNPDGKILTIQVAVKPLSPGRRLTVVILYFAGTTMDDEDTLECVKGVEESLMRLGHTAVKVRVTKENWQEAVRVPGDVFFNFVEDDTWELYMNVIQSLESQGKAQVGHDGNGIRYVTDKSEAKKQMSLAGITTPPYRIISSGGSDAENIGLAYPLIVKPAKQHAGIGISQASVVKDAAGLAKQLERIHAQFPGDVVAEEFVRGREIHVTVVGNGKDLVVLPYCEIGYGGSYQYNWNIYSYEAKWDKSSWEYKDAHVRAPAQVSPQLRERIDAAARRSFAAFACRDVARFDFRISADETPYLVDVNMNPSLNYYDTEDATVASVKALGWTYDQFIETLLAVTYRRVSGTASSLYGKLRQEKEAYPDSPDA